jgi:hypothetical protein
MPHMQISINEMSLQGGHPPQKVHRTTQTLTSLLEKSAKGNVRRDEVNYHQICH